MMSAEVLHLNNYFLFKKRNTLIKFSIPTQIHRKMLWSHFLTKRWRYLESSANMSSFQRFGVDIFQHVFEKSPIRLEKICNEFLDQRSVTHSVFKFQTNIHYLKTRLKIKDRRIDDVSQVQQIRKDGRMIAKLGGRAIRRKRTKTKLTLGSG